MTESVALRCSRWLGHSAEGIGCFQSELKKHLHQRLQTSPHCHRLRRIRMLELLMAAIVVGMISLLLMRESARYWVLRMHLRVDWTAAVSIVVGLIAEWVEWKPEQVMFSRQGYQDCKRDQSEASHVSCPWSSGLPGWTNQRTLCFPRHF